MNDRGNPSDPIEEEAERVRKALQNVQNWQNRYGAEFSGGVSMQMGSGKKYVVPIGDREIAQKVVSRPIEAPLNRTNLIGDNWREAVRAANIPTESDDGRQEQTIRPHRSWFKRVIDRIFGERT